MTAQLQRFEGNAIFGNFNLYGIEDIEDFEQSKKDILTAFETEYKEQIIKVLKSIGLSFEGLTYYSPSAYNFQGDSIDLSIKIFDRNKLNAYVLENQKELQGLLDSNKSYDGYMSLTSYNIDRILEQILKDDLDITVLKYLLSTVVNEDVNYGLIHDNIILEGE